jgi:thioredoxin-like negative regulator of GroEL
MRNAITCLPNWNDNNTGTYTKVLGAVGRYGGQTFLNGLFKQLNSAERDAMWAPIADHLLILPTETLIWATALAPAATDRSRIVGEVLRRKQAGRLRTTLERIWSNDQLPEDDRLVAGRALAGTVKADEFVTTFPLDLETSIPATLLRVDRLVVLGRTNEAATRLATLVPDPTDVPPSFQKDVAEALLKLGDKQRAYDLSVSAAKRRSAVLSAQQRQRMIRERYAAGDVQLARETLTTSARRDPKDADAALNLAVFLLENQDPGGALRVLEAMPATVGTPEHRGEMAYVRSQVAEAAGDLGEATRQLLVLLTVAPAVR